MLSVYFLSIDLYPFIFAPFQEEKYPSIQESFRRWEIKPDQYILIITDIDACTVKDRKHCEIIL